MNVGYLNLDPPIWWGGRGCRNAESAFLYGRMTVFKAGHVPDQKDTFCEHILS